MGGRYPTRPRLVLEHMACFARVAQGRLDPRFQCVPVLREPRKWNAWHRRLMPRHRTHLRTAYTDTVPAAPPLACGITADRSSTGTSQREANHRHEPCGATSFASSAGRSTSRAVRIGHMEVLATRTLLGCIGPSCSRTATACSARTTMRRTCCKRSPCGLWGAADRDSDRSQLRVMASSWWV